MRHKYLTATAATTFAAVAATYSLYALTVRTYNEMPSPAGHVVCAKVKSAMQFHGDRFSTFSDSDGILWFKRDGQVCRLYTDAFEAKWNKNLSKKEVIK